MTNLFEYIKNKMGLKPTIEITPLAKGIGKTVMDYTSSEVKDLDDLTDRLKDTPLLGTEEDLIDFFQPLFAVSLVDVLRDKQKLILHFEGRVPDMIVKL